MTPVTTDEGDFVLASIVDITARRQAEADVAALKQTAEAQAQVIEFADRYTQEQLDAEVARQLTAYASQPINRRR